LISAFLAYGKGRWIGVVLLVSLILAYGAALVSLGQYLSIRARRPGWALPLSTAIYVLAIVVPIPMALMLWGPAEYPGPGLASASPFWGTGFFSAVISDRAGQPSLHWPRMAAWSFAWVVVYSAAAALMYRSALASFDRCLGRIPEEGCGDRYPRSDLVVR
jgi:hypothetical protein